MFFYLMLFSGERQICHYTLTNNLIIYKEIFKLTSATFRPPYLMPHDSQIALAVFKLPSHVLFKTVFMVSLSCEYLFTLMKAKDGQSVLKSCQKKVKKI